VAFVCRSRDFADAAAEPLAVLIAGDIAAELCARAIACAARTSLSCCLAVPGALDAAFARSNSAGFVQARAIPYLKTHFGAEKSDRN
jgi:hypothetical protein